VEWRGGVETALRYAMSLTTSALRSEPRNAVRSQPRNEVEWRQNGTPLRYEPCYEFTNPILYHSSSLDKSSRCVQAIPHPALPCIRVSWTKANYPSDPHTRV